MTNPVTPLLPSPVLQTTGSPASNTTPPQIMVVQGVTNLPVGSSVEVVTSPINNPPSILARLSNFPDQVWNLSDSSLIVRLLRVLLGGAGAGQTRNGLQQARLRTIMEGAQFYELDGNYGALLGVPRFSTERVAAPSYVGSTDASLGPSDLATYDDWDAANAADASYRNRLAQFAAGIALGPSPLGLVAICEAILQVPCDIEEGYTRSTLIFTVGGSGGTATGTYVGPAPQVGATVIPLPTGGGATVSGSIHIAGVHDTTFTTSGGGSITLAGDNAALTS